MAAETLYLYGPFRLEQADGSSLTLAGRKCFRLLAYLAAQPGERHARSRIAGILWPEVDEVRASHSLRQALSDLRTALGPLAIPCLEIDRSALRFMPGPLQLDVLEVQRLLAEGTGPAVLQALHMRRSELLEGIYDDWAEEYRRYERQHTQQLALEVVDRLAGDGTAREICHQLLLHDPHDPAVSIRLPSLLQSHDDNTTKT